MGRKKNVSKAIEHPYFLDIIYTKPLPKSFEAAGNFYNVSALFPSHLSVSPYPSPPSHNPYIGMLGKRKKEKLITA